MLLSVHAMLSAATKTPELSLDPDEAKLLANAAAQVAAHYPLISDPKTLAWVNLAMVAGGIYGTRIVAISLKNAREKGEKKKAKGEIGLGGTFA